jgi:oligopeptide transport system substrate-binding protein
LKRLFPKFGLRNSAFDFQTCFGFRLSAFGVFLSRIPQHASLAVPALALLLAVGCRQASEPADIVIINGAEPEALDPAIITGQPDGRVVGALFEGLTRLNGRTASPEPALAARWDISADGLVYTFHLRTNALWSTGEPVTAEDFVYSWRRVADPATASDYAGQLYFVKHAEAINTAQTNAATGKRFAPEELGVTAVDQRTLRVELVAPTPFFLDLCAFRTLAVVPRWWIEKHGDRWVMEQPVPTSGPYMLDYWRIQDKIRVRRNPLYWDAASTQNNVIDLLPMESATTALNLYETRQADIIWDKNLVPVELMDVLRQRHDCHTFDYLGTYFMRFNVEKKPFNDVRVRKALALVIDKRRIVERLTRAGEKPASCLTPPGTANYEAPEGLGHDPELGRKLLAEAGYPGGRGFPSFNYLYNTAKQHEQIAVELQQMWKKELGITMEVRQVEWKMYLSDQSKLNYDTSRSSWIGDYNDPNTFLDMFMSNNGNNRTGWKSARYDDLIRRGNMEQDKLKRAALLREAETILIRDEVPIVPLFFYVGVNFWRPDDIEGVHNNILDEHPLYMIRRKR